MRHINAGVRIGRIAFAALLSLSAARSDAEPTRNGFDLQGALIPVEEILQGGPPRDGIPSIDKPVFVAADGKTDLRPGDTVLAIHHNGIAKAYPIGILNWHEVVNDRFGSEPIVITFCPLCGSGVAFKATVDKRALRFGVSGLLYNSDVLLYDRETNSLWSQIRAQAVSGPLKKHVLSAVPTVHTTWADWRARHPDTLVLSRDTGHEREYGRDPYDGYEQSEQLLFPVRFRGEGFHPKERVLGVLLNGKAKAYPFVELAKGGGEVKDTLGGQSIKILYSAAHRSARAVDARDRPIVATTLFWFAWAAFHPETQIHRAAEGK